MRIAFAGTPEFARVALSALLAAGHDIALVLTQPDRPAGRGLKLTPSPVKQAALDAGIEVLQPRSLRLDGKYPEEAAAAQDALRAAGIQLMVVAAYGLILPRSALELPPRGCLNIHASLLPRWRGAAPIQRAIESDDRETGITIMQMDEGLDTGAMLSRSVVPIAPSHTAAELHDLLAQAGGDLIVRTLAQAENGPLVGTPQPEEGVTYAAKLDKAESLLDWQASAALLARRVRAFNPVPGASLRLAGLDDPVKVWRASALPATAASAAAAPGMILRADADGIDVATADGVLRLLELQKAGGKRQPVEIFVRGWSAPATC